MRTPVLIPVRNEAAQLRTTLEHLDASVVEPIVIINDTHDNSADIARGVGITVLESAAGKMPAMQEGLRFLAARSVESALSPILIMDADTEPLHPTEWPRMMYSGLSGAPIGSGLYVAGDGDSISKVMMSGLRVANVVRKLITHEAHMSGMNMMIDLKQRRLLDAILGLPNIWPGEDLALAFTLLGNECPPVTLHPHAAVRTSSRFLPKPLSMLVKGRATVLREAEESRIRRAAVGAISFEDYKLMIKHHDNALDAV